MSDARRYASIRRSRSRRCSSVVVARRCRPVSARRAHASGVAVIKHLLYCSAGNVPCFRGGKWIRVDALSEPEEVRFPYPIGALTVSHTGHPEQLTLPRSIAVDEVTCKGTVLPRLAGERERFTIVAVILVALLLVVQGEQPEGRITTVIEQQVVVPGRGQMLAGEHTLTDMAGLEIRLDHQIVENVIQAREACQRNRGAFGWRTERGDHIVRVGEAGR